MRRICTIVFGLTVVMAWIGFIGIIVEKTYRERLEYQSGYLSCMSHVNYVEHHVLTKKQKWKIAHHTEGELKAYVSKQASISE